MDAIVSAALSEICSQGPNGVSIPDLWQRLQHQESLSSSGLNLCAGVKTAIWTGVLNIPGLQFQSENGCFDSQDPHVRSFEQAERLGLRIVAAEHLRDCFVGIYDVKAADAGVSEIQRRVLDRLALARSNGVTQSELAKEFGIKGNKIFYIVRNLECRGLVVRQSTIVRTKENSNEGENELKNTSIVHTNLIHLYRYAKHLTSQQILEITKANTSENPTNTDANTLVDDFAGEGVKDDILVKDYLPAIKAVCDKLEEADGKVLVVSDIKQALGYRGTHGHRAWRNICNRLKDAGLVEVFNAEVNKKVVSCLRLVKSFNLNKFQPKHVGSGCDDLDSDQPVKCGKRGQITDQLLELPIEHQIYDMIDAEGQKGLTVTEICKRLGLNHKKNYTRLLNMFPRFGIHLQAESHNRSMQYRVWTSRNINKGIPNGMNAKPDDILDEGGSSMHSAGNHVDYEKSDPTLNLDFSTTDGGFSTPSKVESGRMGLESHCHFPGDDGLNQTITHGTSPLALSHARVGTDSKEESDLISLVSASNNSPIETASLVSSNPSRLRSYPRYPCLTLTDVSTKREQRILEWLQEEKFILTVELYRWLESLDKEKRTTMARKTLARTLNKLQQEGHCKCIQVSVPVVTNCGRNRTTGVVVHKSFPSLPPELLGQIHERLRAFDMQSRGRGLARLKNEKSVPVLTNIKRTSNHSNSESQAVRAEAMRTNGFIIAKMVRAKLLHNFLWSYLRTSPDWSDALSAGRHGYDIKNPHSTCKLFALDVAIKAMPLELFLQVVGSTNKFDDLVELCKRGVSLSDVPKQLYKSLMDTRATGRLSWIVDILRRLKLVRLVTDGDFEDGDMVQCAALRYALELKPYIEEPLSSVPQSSGVGFLDLRPRIRHDFILMNKEAVDIYWNTLEYCYATADPTLAVHAFPGSAVQEVFQYRSWASVRVMTVDQRAELIKQVVRTGPNKKLSFSDCVKIAKDLNLTLEQVLRVYYDKQQSRLDRFQSDLDPSEEGSRPMTSNHTSNSRRRKKRRSSKCLKSDTANEESSGQRMLTLLDNDVQYADEQTPLNYSGDVDSCLDAWDEDGQANTADESELNEEDGNENYDFIDQCAFSRVKPTRQSKFSWTDLSDRQLVIQYVRYRAALGARFHRTDWVSLPGLPAPPSACRRRMAFLNSNRNVRKAVMRLCNLLGERYTQHLSKTQEKELLKHHVSGQSNQKTLSRKVGISLGKVVESDGEHKWDDFEDKNVKTALEEVLQLKEMAKVEASRGGELTPGKDWPDANFDMDLQEEPEGIMSKSNDEETQNNSGKRKRRSSCHRLPGKLLKLLNEGISVSRRAYESLAVANAVELLKLVFLSTSKAPGVPNLLAETLRRYSEHDLFAAFKYLRQKKYMVGGNGSQPFVLSQQFLHNISSSPFPTNTGKRAVKFASWLQDREKDLMEEAVYLNEDLQCGDIYHLLALVSSGKLCISPCLPDKGIGEAEREEVCSDNNVKKLNSSPTKDGIGDFISRREKGFPGIKVSLGCATISTADTVELFKNEIIQTKSCLFNDNDNDPFNSSELGRGDSFSCSDKLKPNQNFDSITCVAKNSNESPWKAMSSYSEHLVSAFSEKELVGPLNPEIFKAVSSEIHKAGDQGLSMEELSKFVAMQGTGQKMAELLVDVLQIFGLAVKVNAYNSVHVVDGSFRSKYFLTSLDGRYQDLRPAPCVDSSSANNNEDFTLTQEHKNGEASSNPDYMHKVTVLNVPEEVFQLSNEPQTQAEDIQPEECMQVEVVSPEAVCESEAYKCSNSGNPQSFRPIFPWVNGDGTTNLIVFKGLMRRILGIVMQNPGIQEKDILYQMDVLNPQSCRKLLELMILDNNLIVRKMYQTISSGPPSMLLSLFGSNSKKSEAIYREHFYANPMSTSLL